MRGKQRYLEAVEKYKEKEAGEYVSWTPTGYVYLLGNKSFCFYKIGLTQSLETPGVRFKTIQQGVPFDLEVCRYWYVKYVHAFERLLHYTFESKNIRGEWFKFEAEELDGVIATIDRLVKEITDKQKEWK
jgi:hypothetical protein